MAYDPERIGYLPSAPRWFPGARLFLDPGEGEGGAGGEGVTGGDGDAGDAGGGGGGDSVEDRLAKLEAKNDEFRGNNRKLFNENKQLRERLAQFDGLSPDMIKALTAKFADDESDEVQKLMAAGEVDKAFDLRNKRLRDDYESKLSERDATIAEFRDRDAVRLRADTVRKAIDSKKLRVRPNAQDIIARMAADVFKVDDSGKKLVAIDADSQADPLTPDSWIDSLLQSHGYLFDGGAGGGGGGGGGAGGKRTIRYSELTPKKMGELADDISTGKVQVIDG